VLIEIREAAKASGGGVRRAEAALAKLATASFEDLEPTSEPEDPRHSRR
jgi:hypothetical protein